MLFTIKKRRYFSAAARIIYICIKVRAQRENPCCACTFIKNKNLRRNFAYHIAFGSSPAGTGQV